MNVNVNGGCCCKGPGAGRRSCRRSMHYQMVDDIEGLQDRSLMRSVVLKRCQDGHSGVAMVVASAVRVVTDAAVADTDVVEIGVHYDRRDRRKRGRY